MTVEKATRQQRVDIGALDLHVSLACGMLWLLGGVAAVLAGLAVAHAFGAAQGVAVYGAALAATAGMALSIMSLVAAFGLTRGRPWGWMAGLLACWTWSLLMVPFGWYGLYALLRGQVRDAFVPKLRRSPPALAPRQRQRAQLDVQVCGAGASSHPPSEPAPELEIRELDGNDMELVATLVLEDDEHGPLAGRARQTTQLDGTRKTEITNPNWPAPRPPQRRRHRARLVKVADLPVSKRIWWDPRLK